MPILIPTRIIIQIRKSDACDDSDDDEVIMCSQVLQTEEGLDDEQQPPKHVDNLKVQMQQHLRLRLSRLQRALSMPIHEHTQCGAMQIL